MILKKYKKYLGLCQCKGCLNFYDDTLIATYPVNTKLTLYVARLCSLHACEAITIPFVEVRRF